MGHVLRYPWDDCVFLQNVIDFRDPSKLVRKNGAMANRDKLFPIYLCSLTCETLRLERRERHVWHLILNFLSRTNDESAAEVTFRRGPRRVGPGGQSDKLNSMSWHCISQPDHASSKDAQTSVSIIKGVAASRRHSTSP